MKQRVAAAQAAPDVTLTADIAGILPTVADRLARILEGRDFPALSQQIGDTISALEDDASSIQRLTNVVLREYSLTLSVVRTANSAHYRRADRQIQSVTRAMVLLGARTVRQLASSILLFENYRKHSAGLKELMLLSLLTANHAREVSVALGVTDPEEAHLCGMCRNLGEVLIACHFPVDYARIHARIRDRQQSEASAVHAVLGFRYEALGIAMCRHWGLPESVSDAIRGTATAVTNDAAAITAFAHELTNVLYRRSTDDGYARRDLDTLIARHAARLHLSRTQVRQVIARSLEETREIFTTAKVKVDALRIRQLSDAACSALGVAALEGGDAGEHETDRDTPMGLEGCRAELHAELEGKVDPASECDLGQVLLLALEGALRGAPFDRVVACVLSPDRSRLRARSGLGPGVELLLAQFDFPMTAAGGALPALLLQQEMVYLPVMREMTALEARLKTKLGIGQFGIFPIIVDAQIVGCIYGDRSTATMLPDDATLAYVTSLTGLVVRAIEARRAVPAARHATLPSRTPPATECRELSPHELATFAAESKAALVMRVLQGEPLHVVAASSGVPAVQLELWRHDFLAGAMDRLATPPGNA